MLSRPLNPLFSEGRWRPSVWISPFSATSHPVNASQTGLDLCGGNVIVLTSWSRSPDVSVWGRWMRVGDLYICWLFKSSNSIENFEHDSNLFRYIDFDIYLDELNKMIELKTLFWLICRWQNHYSYSHSQLFFVSINFLHQPSIHSFEVESFSNICEDIE